MVRYRDSEKFKRVNELKCLNRSSLISLIIKYEFKKPDFFDFSEFLGDLPTRRASPIILKRDSYKCKLCLSEEDLQVHHITPKSHGGRDNIFNLITLCSKCHHFIHHCNPMIKFGVIGTSHSQLTKLALDKLKANGFKLGRPIKNKELYPQNNTQDTPKPQEHRYNSSYIEGVK